MTGVAQEEEFFVIFMQFFYYHYTSIWNELCTLSKNAEWGIPRRMSNKWCVWVKEDYTSTTKSKWISAWN